MNLFSEIAQSMIRKLLVLFFGWIFVPLIAHAWIGADLGDRIRGSLDNWAAIIVGTVLTLITPFVWAWWKWIAAKARVVLASKLPPSKFTTVAQANQEVATQAAALPIAATLRTAINGDKLVNTF